MTAQRSLLLLVATVALIASACSSSGSQDCSVVEDVHGEPAVTCVDAAISADESAAGAKGN